MIALEGPPHHLCEAEQEARMARHFAAADARQIVQLATQTATHEGHPTFHEPEENASQWMALHGGILTAFIMRLQSSTH